MAGLEPAIHLSTGSGKSVKNLIITADDFGAAEAVNDAVEQAHKDGILTAASLMVSGAAAADAVRRAHAMPNLRVGLHLVLVDGQPILPPASVPDLVDMNGNFRNEMARAGAAMFFRPGVRRQLEAEMEAQFTAFAATGLTLDHVNAHKHFHLHPTIAALIAKLGRKYGARGARVPLEPAEILVQVEPVRVNAAMALTMPFARRLSRHFARAGIAAPDQVFGLAWSGAMRAERLAGILTHLPAGLSEIYMHPATGNYPGSTPGYDYAAELAALTDPRMRALIKGGDIRLGGFADFPVQWLGR
jgi:chitin disaccharide deacetylase